MDLISILTSDMKNALPLCGGSLNRLLCVLSGQKGIKVPTYSNSSRTGL